ncbi:MAG: hypothetical protein KF830_18885 [Planctomycetes bacterium]|nr:hypothetical protein [Planctomycetota bacterium]
MHSAPLRTSPLLLVWTLAAVLPAPTNCPNFGSVPVPAQLTASPLPLGCAGAPQWPQWHLWMPAHRTPAPHPGHAPGDARELPCWLIRYQCTGFLLVPALPVEVRRMGYVIDQPEHRCALKP